MMWMLAEDAVNPWATMWSTGYGRIAVGVVVLLVAAFLLVSWKDLALLVQRPGGHRKGRGLGMGLGRVWALARNSISEGWGARAWMLPVIWLPGCLVINLAVVPYDVTERAGLYLRTLLWGQEMLLLVLVGMLACFSLPRERDRRTIITTGSKPISRLELYLGKVVGFSVLAGMLLVVMGVVTVGYMYVVDKMQSRQAAEAYRIQEVDFNSGKAGAAPPSEVLKRQAESGTLEARNYITVHKGGFQVAGAVEYRDDLDNPLVRYMKGGSTEQLIFQLPTLWGVPGTPGPYFCFQFDALATGGPLPETITLSVTVGPRNYVSPGQLQEHTVTLRQARNGKTGELAVVRDPQTNAAIRGIYIVNWRPEETEWVVKYGENDNVGPLGMIIKCGTSGVLLRVQESRDPNDSNVLAMDLDPARSASPLAPLGSPKMVGFEKNGMQQIEGIAVQPGGVGPEVASWRFREKDLGGVPVDGKTDKFKVAMYLDVENATKNLGMPTYAEVTAYTQVTQRQRGEKGRVRVPVRVEEKRLTEVTLPASLLRDQSDMYLDVRCVTEGHWVGATETAVRLEQPSSPFVWNLAKSEMVIWCEAVLLVVIGVASSIRLGGWVALLVTGVAYLLGNLFTFIQALVENGPESLFSAADRKQLEGSWFYEGVTLMQGAAVKLLYFVVHVLPDFRVFDAAKYIAESRNMPWWVLASDMGWTMVYALPFLALAYLMVRKQELA